MNFPDKIFLYQRDNRDDAPWSVAVSKSSLPAGIKVGVYDLKKRVKIIITVDEEEIPDKVPVEAPPPAEVPPEVAP